jgi:hypothetical protein
VLLVVHGYLPAVVEVAAEPHGVTVRMGVLLLLQIPAVEAAAAAQVVQDTVSFNGGSKTWKTDWFVLKTAWLLM